MNVIKESAAKVLAKINAAAKKVLETLKGIPNLPTRTKCILCAGMVVFIAAIVVLAVVPDNQNKADNAAEEPQNEVQQIDIGPAPDISQEDYARLEAMLQESISCWMFTDKSFDSSAADASLVINEFLMCKPEPVGVYTYFCELDCNEYGEWNYPDPLNRGFDAYRLDADKADWIIENVFGVTPDRSAYNENYYYYEDKLYVSCELGGGPAFKMSILEKNYLGDGKFGITAMTDIDEDFEDRGEYVYVDIYYFVVSLCSDDTAGNYWRIHNFSASEKCYQTADYSEADWAHACMKQLRATANDYHSQSIWDADVFYSVFDLNRDGVNDLIVRSGTCEADMMYHFYVFDTSSNQMCLCGSTGGGHSVMYEDKSTGELYQWNQHMGTVTISRISVSGNDIELKVVSQGKDVDYYVDYENSSKLSEQYKDFVLIEEYEQWEDHTPIFRDVIGNDN